MCTWSSSGHVGMLAARHFQATSAVKWPPHGGLFNVGGFIVSENGARDLSTDMTPAGANQISRPCQIPSSRFVSTGNMDGLAKDSCPEVICCIGRMCSFS